MGAPETRRPGAHRPRPHGLLRAVFALPSGLYHRNLGWLPTRRLLLLTYRGRRSGRTLTAVLEAIHHDRATGESVVSSAYGPTAGWYLSIQASPSLRVQSGRLDYVPCQRFLSPREARRVAEEFVRAHPWEARLIRPVLAWIGAGRPGRRESPVELLASLPMVAFRPADGMPASRDAQPGPGDLTDPPT